MKLMNQKKGTVIATRVTVADSFFSRAVGLLGRRQLAAGEGLLLKPCNNVHTVGMSFPIDVIFVDADMVVLKVVCGLKPCRLATCAGATATLELKAGEGTGVDMGDQLAMEGFA